MPLQCSFTGGVEILHLNLRKTDPNDSDTLAADVKMIGQLESDVLPALLCCAATEVSNLWHYDKDRTPRFPMIEKIVLTNAYKQHYLVLRGHEFVGVDIKKLSYSVKNHRRIELTFSATIDHPDDAEVMLLTELLQNSAPCRIDCDPDLFSDLEQRERVVMGLLSTPDDENPEEQGEMELGASGVYESDPMYVPAEVFVRHSGKASISALQRKLKIGYNRAARLIEALEAQGVVSPMGNDGSRTVLMKGTELA